MADKNKKSKVFNDDVEAKLHWFYIQWMEKKGKKAVTVESIGALIDETKEAYYLASNIDITNGAIIKGLPILKSKILTMNEMVVKNGPSKYLVIGLDKSKAIDNVGVFEAKDPEHALLAAKEIWPNSDDVQSRDFRLCLNNWSWFDLKKKMPDEPIPDSADE